jgi:anti-sigma-K factor RskA
MTSPGPEGTTFVTHEDWRTAAASCALGALDAADARAFEAHLAACPDCQTHLSAYRRVATGLLASVDSAAPPAALKAATLARATLSNASARSAELAPRRAGTPPPSWWLVAATVTLAVGLGVYALSLRTQVDALHEMVANSTEQERVLRTELAGVRRDSVRLIRAVDVLSAPDLVHVDLAGQATASGAVGRAFWSRARGLVFSADRMPALAAGHVYQLWVLAPGPVNVGLLTVGSDGVASLAAPLPPGLPRPSAVAVTAEPGPRGSATPTMPILLIGQIKSSN